MRPDMLFVVVAVMVVLAGDAGAVPSVDVPEIPDLPNGVNLYPFSYDKDMYADKFARWRRLYFGDEIPQRCGDCDACRA